MLAPPFTPPPSSFEENEVAVEDLVFSSEAAAPAGGLDVAASETTIVCGGYWGSSSLSSSRALSSSYRACLADMEAAAMAFGLGGWSLVQAASSKLPLLRRGELFKSFSNRRERFGRPTPAPRPSFTSSCRACQ